MMLPCRDLAQFLLGRVFLVFLVKRILAKGVVCGWCVALQKNRTRVRCVHAFHATTNGVPARVSRDTTVLSAENHRLASPRAEATLRVATHSQSVKTGVYPCVIAIVGASRGAPYRCRRPC